MDEIALIERFRKKIRLDSTVVKGSGDDAAVIRWTKGKHLLFTCDMLIENTHFRLKEANPYRVGWKAMAVNISDIASMGGIPRHAVVSLGIPKGANLSLIDGVFSGVKALADKFKINIVGGDVNVSDKLIIDIAMIGEAKKKELATRSGAKVGDIIMVTGNLGGSKYGKHLNFMPRVKEANFLVRNFKINSMTDISDGLSSDLTHVCHASKTGAKIYESLIPLSRHAKSIKNALSDGEDFELLLTVNKKYAAGILSRFKKETDTAITAIGEMTSKAKGIKIIDRFGRINKLKPTGFKHF